MENIQRVESTHNEFWRRIRNGDVYSHARFGDGEWRSILGTATSKGRNCDGHRYFTGMRRELASVLLQRPGPPFLLGMQSYGFKMFRGRILTWLHQNHLQHLRWYNADTLAMHQASGKGTIHHYFEALATKSVIMVGPPHLHLLKKRRLVDFASHIVSPKRDAYQVLPQLYRKVLKAYSQLKPPVVISISCGLPAGILVHRLFQSIGTEAFIFDAGSVYDVYCGVASRKYMRVLRKKWQEGKGHAPNRVRAQMEASAARSDPAVREDGGERQGDP